METTAVPGTRYSIRTGESEVRLVQKEQVYYKLKNPFAKLHLKKHPDEYVLFEHVVHNILFPDCRLEFLGVTEELHEARLVFRQQAVRSETRPNAEQIADDMRCRGLKPGNRYEFGNGYVFITDVGENSDNVLVDDDGRLRFIDPIIGFKAKFQRVLDDMLKLEQEIDEIVYGLYGLTAEERAIVEKSCEQPEKAAKKPAAAVKPEIVEEF